MASKKKSGVGVALLEDDDTPPEFADGDDFKDIEQFLAEYQGQKPLRNPALQKHLATSWRDKRQELSKLHKARWPRQWAETFIPG